MNPESFNLKTEHPIQILVAEDNFVNRTLLKKIFEKIGYAVVLAQDGIDALNAFEKRYYDIVFMDIEMPGKNGFEVTRILRDKFKDPVKKPYIIALTANCLDGERERCIEEGMDDYLAKPFTMNDVEKLIEKALIIKNN